MSQVARGECSHAHASCTHFSATECWAQMRCSRLGTQFSSPSRRAMSWALAATSSKNAASDSGKFSSPAIRRNSRTPTPPVRRVGPPRSEERRVGKECRARGAQKEKKKKEKKYNE